MTSEYSSTSIGIPLIGIAIMLIGFALNFSILASLKIYDFWFGLGFIAIPIIIGGSILLLGMIRGSYKEEKDNESRCPIK